MDWNSTIELIQAATQEHRSGKDLKEAEVIVLDAAWRNIPFEEAAEHSRYSLNYLQRNVAPGLWKLISSSLFDGAKVDKNNFRSLFEKLHRPRYFGGHLPDNSQLIDRDDDERKLKELTRSAQFIFLCGEPGIGKTILASKIVQDCKNGESDFEYIVWQSVHYQPSLQGFLESINSYFKFIRDQDSLQENVTRFIELLKGKRWLIVLDEADGLYGLEASSTLKQDYFVFFRRLVEEAHHGCIIATTRYISSEISMTRSLKGFPVEVYNLLPMNSSSITKIFEASGITARQSWPGIAHLCMGNPLIAKLVAQKIQNLSGGSLQSIYQQKTSIVADALQTILRNTLSEDILSNTDKVVLHEIVAFIEKRGQQNISLQKIVHLLEENFQDKNISSFDILKSINRLEDLYLVQSHHEEGNKYLSISRAVRKFIISKQFTDLPLV